MSLPIIQTIQNNINSLKSTKTDIKNAVNTDYDFIANEQIESYPGLIKQGIAHYKNRVPHATKEGTDLSFNAAPLKFENMTIKGDTSQATSILPEGYTQLDYIESDGTQYIDTGVNADSNLRVVMDFQYTTNSEGDGNIGAIYSSGSTYKRYHILPRGSSGKIDVFLNTTAHNTVSKDTNRHLMDISNTKIVVDNNEYSVSVADFDTTINFWLLGRNSNDSSLLKLSKSRVYKCKMWYSNTLVRDFIPCYRNSDNEVGLYDMVNNIFYPNQGTGVFTYGATVSIPNPDYPQDIHVVTGNNTINIGGTNYPVNLTSKNLFNISTITPKTYLDRYGNTGGSNVSDLSDYIEVNPNTSYKLSFNYETLKNSSTRGCCYYDKNKSYITGNTYEPSNKGATMTTPSSAKYIRFSYDQNCFDIQLEEGSTATDYQGYYDIELCKIGDYQDYLYKENGNWYKYETINKRILNENGYYTVSSSKIYTPDISDYSRSNNIPVCNYFTGEINKESISEMTNNNTVAFNKDEQYNRFYIYNSEFNTTQNFKNWLVNHNLIVYYALSTPTSTQITDTTLIEQLEALDKAKGNNGTTIITSNGTDLAPILNFTAYLKEVE